MKNVLYRHMKEKHCFPFLTYMAKTLSLASETELLECSRQQIHKEKLWLLSAF